MALDFGALQDSTAQQAIEPQLTEATPLEVQSANAAQYFHDFLTPGALRQQQRYNEAGPETPWGGAVDPRSVGSDADAAAAERGPGPVRSMIQPEDANAQAKAAGVNITFDKPIPATTAQSVIDDHVTRQQQDAVIARNGNSILSGSAARFAAGSFLSLLDPVNLAAMMIPAAPEAFVAEKLAAASGVFERGLIRGAAGAANGAVGMAALEPLQYAMDKADYNDWSAGDALRRVFMGAAIGAAGHVALGGLFGREHLTPERADDAMTATRGAIAQVMDDRPVDTAVIGDHAALRAEADYLESRAASGAGSEGLVAFHGTPHAVDAFDIGRIGTGEGAQAFGHGLYFAEDKGLADWYRRVLSQGDMTPDLEATLTDLHETIKARQATVQDMARGGYPIGTPEADAAIAPHDARIAELNKQLSDHGEARDGNLYQVIVKSDRKAMLDWDKPLDVQTPQVQQGLRAMGLMGDDGIQGADLGSSLSPTTAESAAAFRANGINGVQYLDAKSRRAGEGTRNLVVFHHDDVQITHRNGVPVQAAIADLRAQADTLAKQAAERAMNPAVDPEVARAQTTVKAAIDGAPKITEDVDKNTAEQTKLAAEFHQIIQGEIKAGRLVETAEMRSAMLAADETDRVGKAAADYAACLVGKGGI